MLLGYFFLGLSLLSILNSLQFPAIVSFDFFLSTLLRILFLPIDPTSLFFFFCPIQFKFYSRLFSCLNVHSLLYLPRCNYLCIQYICFSYFSSFRFLISIFFFFCFRHLPKDLSQPIKRSFKIILRLFILMAQSRSLSLKMWFVILQLRV